MKMNSMQKIKSALESLNPEIKLNEELRTEAQTSLDRMMAITSGKPVVWPTAFTK